MGFHTGGNIPGRPCFLPVAGGRVVCLTGVAPGFDDARLAAWEDGRVRSYKGRESSMRRMLFATAAVAALAWGGGSVAVADTPDDTLVMASQIDDIITLEDRKSTRLNSSP